VIWEAALFRDGKLAMHSPSYATLAVIHTWPGSGTGNEVDIFTVFQWLERRSYINTKYPGKDNKSITIDSNPNQKSGLCQLCVQYLACHRNAMSTVLF
jgi:hypothetical protein